MRLNERSVLSAVWSAGRLSRSQLRDLTGLTPNGVGLVADELVQLGLLRECPPEPGAGAGRPRVPLEIDPTSRQVVGLGIGPGTVEMIRVGFGGTPVSKPQVRNVSNPAKLIAAATELLSAGINRQGSRQGSRPGNHQVIGVGVSVTGFVDPVDRAILFSSSQPTERRVSLAPALAVAGELPLVLENDMHALAARWLLGRRGESSKQDVLLISVGDGRLGAAVLVDGRPNRGCVTGGNELGHTRFFVETDRCYCGHVGCLERVVTTEFLHRCDREFRSTLPGDLPGRIAAAETSGQSDRSLERVIEYLACGVANAINFVRPHRVVLVNKLADRPAFNAALKRAIRGWLLPELIDRVQLEVGSETVVGAAETAAWLAIAEILHGGWGRVPVAEAG